MTPKEKAKELYFKYFNLENHLQIEVETGYREDDYGISSYCAKQCAIIAVNEIIEELEDKKQYIDDNMLFDWNNKIIKYWEQVKQEIYRCYIRENK